MRSLEPMVNPSKISENSRAGMTLLFVHAVNLEAVFSAFKGDFSPYAHLAMFLTGIEMEESNGWAGWIASFRAKRAAPAESPILHTLIIFDHQKTQQHRTRRLERTNINSWCLLAKQESEPVSDARIQITNLKHFKFYGTTFADGIPLPSGSSRKRNRRRPLIPG